MPLAFLPSFQEQTACCLGHNDEVSVQNVWPLWRYWQTGGKTEKDVLIKRKKRGKVPILYMNCPYLSGCFFASFLNLESDSQDSDCISHQKQQKHSHL